MQKYQSIFSDHLFQDKLYIVTGGGTGIGRAISHELASLGATVIIAARKVERLESVKAEIESYGGQVETHVVNIRDEESVSNLFSTILETHSKVDGLVNNAGGQFPSPAEAITKKGWHAVVETNLTGTFLMCKEAYNRSMSKHGGTIVNIIAEMWRGFPGMVHTGAARAGVDNLTKTLAIEWAKSGVRINSVAPGLIKGHGLTQYDPAFVESFVAEASKDIPLKRMGTESEIASTVTFLLSPAAAYISGETIKVDGASSLWRKTWEIPDHENSEPFHGLDA